MKRIIAYIEKSFDSAAPALALFVASTVVLFCIYRVNIFLLIKDVYPELDNLSFADYIGLGLHYDAGIALIMITVVILVLLLPRLSRAATFMITGFFLIIQSAFIFLAVDFFKTYETTFQMNFFGEENATDLHGFFISLHAEMSAWFFVKFAIATGIILLCSIAVYRYIESASVSGRGRYYDRGLHFGAIGKLSILLTLLFIGIAYAASASPGEHGNVMARFTDMPQKKVSAMLHEISMNPLFNLFVAGISDPLSDGAGNTAGGDGFKFQFNTDSLESDRMHRRLTAIPQGGKYNIIIYFFESTSSPYVDLSVNGMDVTPNWKRLSRNALVMKNHYAHYPLSANAMLSIFASAYDLNSKKLVIQNYSRIKLKTISEILKENGYRTFLTHTGMLEYAGQKRFLQGRKFDRIEDLRVLKTPPYTGYVGWGLDDRALIKPTLRFIAEDPGKPFFISIFPVSPHHPYPVPEKRFEIAGEKGTDTSPRQEMWMDYLNSLHYSDAVAGELIDALEREGYMENTLFFLVADHGEAFYQHRKNYNHPFFIYEENVHVPFIIYNKKLFPEPEIFSGVTRHIDILPTILDILGISRREEYEGVGILSPHREQFALLHTAWKDDLMGIRDGRWKYIVRTSDSYEELYDIEKDPAEKTNIADKHPEVTARYRKIVFLSRSYKDEYYRRMLADYPKGGDAAAAGELNR